MAKEERPYGRYVLEERIAMGGMAEIFRARLATEGFEKRVCIKRILPHFLEDEEFVTMFRDEARTAAKLQHANCVHVFDFGEVTGTLFLAMELVDGSDLRRIMEASRKKRIPLELGEAVQITIDVCRGLHHAHNLTENGKPLGVVHRDVSPHNVLVSRAGEVKVTDFGIARAAERSTHTSTGIVKGKVAYMSPEQAQGLDFDHRLDQFATGVILWEMLTGMRLFTGENDAAILKKVLACDIPPPSSARSAVPAALDDVVLKALSADPKDRYADMRQLELALSRFLYSGAVDPATADVRNIFPRIMADASPQVPRKTMVVDAKDIANDIAVEITKRPEVPPTIPDVKSAPAVAAPGPALSVVQPENVAQETQTIGVVSPQPTQSASEISMVFASSEKNPAAAGSSEATAAPAPSSTGPSISVMAPASAGSRPAPRAPVSPDAPTIMELGPADLGTPSPPVVRAPGKSASSSPVATEVLPSLADLERLDESARTLPAPDATPATRSLAKAAAQRPPETQPASVTATPEPSPAPAAAPALVTSSPPLPAARGRAPLAAASLIVVGGVLSAGIYVGTRPATPPPVVTAMPAPPPAPQPIVESPPSPVTDAVPAPPVEAPPSVETAPPVEAAPPMEAKHPVQEKKPVEKKRVLVGLTLPAGSRLAGDLIVDGKPVGEISSHDVTRLTLTVGRHVAVIKTAAGDRKSVSFEVEKEGRLALPTAE